ncbi:hypothetical protein [Paenibacillus sacheonensis]|uniref:Uncharacterized protein n=1 Tax=Paenibacillus sacheonensis TaxID=742054 RepID=A0A7X4YT27_9BACL|nr:hypothetical protein [Paenibacillus sacheonensis]MBM7568357.1 MFS family permease [Paenibacillus sacheonensis]NBC72057.1 hypothetical protein [Paenibacillus sacheonensis]
MNPWDVLLIAVVSAQALAASYLFHPKWKALVFGLPFPFTFAYLAVGQQVNILNILSLALMFLFMQAVRGLHVGWRVPIIAAVAASAAGYCLCGYLMAQAVPIRGELFWIGAAAAFLLALALLRWMPPREEPGERTALPPWVKVPLTVCLVTLLVLGKQELQGFITFFPFVGVFVAYEARRSLWTMGRQNAVVMVTVLPMLAVMRLVFPSLGAGGAVLAGWCAFMPSLLLVTRMRRQGRIAPDMKKPPAESSAGG